MAGVYRFWGKLPTWGILFSGGSRKDYEQAPPIFPGGLFCSGFSLVPGLPAFDRFENTVGNVSGEEIFKGFLDDIHRLIRLFF